MTMLEGLHAYSKHLLKGLTKKGSSGLQRGKGNPALHLKKFVVVDIFTILSTWDCWCRYGATRKDVAQTQNSQ